MYSMKKTCDLTNLKYETLKFYCNEGLVPGVKRDKNNRRVFDDSDITFIRGLNCVRKCGMSINELKRYVSLIQEGENTILERKNILASKKEELLIKLKEIQDSIDYINWKQEYYDDILKKITR